MNILYFTQYFPPEVGATQTRAWEMSRYLAERGHRVTVVTEAPNHPSGIIAPAYRGKLMRRSREEGVDVLRLWVAASPEKTFRTRMAFYLSYMGMASVAGSLVKGSYDLVYATSPPLFVGAAGLFAATARRIPFVFEVRDLWPESAVALGELSSKRAIALAEKLERLLYKRASRIVAVTEGIKSRLTERGLGDHRIAYIPNGANTEGFRYDEAAGREVSGRLGFAGKRIAMYAGIHGIAQGLETVLEAARHLQTREEIAFVFVGEGPRKAHLMRLSREMGLDKVSWLPEVPSNQMYAYLSAATCSIVPLKDEPIFRGALPSKMFEAWACERPVVLSVAGEARGALEKAGGGMAIPPEDPIAMSNAISYLADHPREAAEMGRRGRLSVEEYYSRREQAHRLESLLLEVKRMRHEV